MTVFTEADEAVDEADEAYLPYEADEADEALDEGYEERAPRRGYRRRVPAPRPSSYGPPGYGGAGPGGRAAVTSGVLEARLEAQRVALARAIRAVDTKAIGIGDDVGRLRSATRRREQDLQGQIPMLALLPMLMAPPSRRISEIGDDGRVLVPGGGTDMLLPLVLVMGMSGGGLGGGGGPGAGSGQGAGMDPTMLIMIALLATGGLGGRPS
ncbi:hypothetical protein [Actinomadura rupiterrae]|uniref:hypothetical protein n=1 Tax=Actinomadura rupiterrae TaxID=559627 RepID=UPI0020A48403|nr:hypothetical protein [Actinomadura rupiterrae]MCP2341530.1 hypothetical protein [Actinomadura rupiterrae]